MHILAKVYMHILFDPAVSVLEIYDNDTFQKYRHIHKGLHYSNLS